jgi:hypothetical protein
MPHIYTPAVLQGTYYLFRIPYTSMSDICVEEVQEGRVREADMSDLEKLLTYLAAQHMCIREYISLKSIGEPNG